MDIISSLATLSYDKRRSKFFNELIILSSLDKKIIEKIFYTVMGRCIRKLSVYAKNDKKLCLDYKKTKL